jgi:hypothetical protein
LLDSVHGGTATLPVGSARSGGADFRTLADVRTRHIEAIDNLCLQVLKLCRQMLADSCAAASVQHG